METACFLELICEVVALERDKLEMLYCSSTLVVCSHIWFVLVLYQTLHDISLIISHLKFSFTVPLHYTLANGHDERIQLYMFRLLLCKVSHCFTTLWA